MTFWFFGYTWHAFSRLQPEKANYLEIASRKRGDLFKFASRKYNRSAEVSKVAWLAHDAETGKSVFPHPRKAFHYRCKAGWQAGGHAGRIERSRADFPKKAKAFCDNSRKISGNVFLCEAMGLWHTPSTIVDSNSIFFFFIDCSRCCDSPV